MTRIRPPAVASGAYVALAQWRKRDRPPFILGGNVQVLATPPTLAWSGPGGASPINGGSPTTLPYNTAQVSARGAVLQLKTQFSTDYWQNVINGGGTQNPWAVEFDHYGSDFALRYRDAAGTGGYFKITVDGQVYATTATQASGITPAGGSLFRMRVTFPSAALRRIRIDMHLADFGGLDIGPTDTVSPVSTSPFRAVVLGDSYTQGALSITALDTFVPTLGRQLGWEVANCGQGGTGFLNVGAGANATFGDTTRVTPIATYAPDAIVVVGGRNDDGSSSSAVGTAAASLFAALTAIVPASRLFVVGPQTSGSGATYVPAARTANNTAIAAAAAAAGATYIDWITGAWFTGTGKSNTPAGDGNADIFTGTDAVHPTQAGHDYIGRRIAVAVASALAA